MTQDASTSTSAAVSLPEPLPAGERIVWQGKPSAKGLALHSFHVREVALYFGVVATWRIWSQMSAGASAGEAVSAAAWLTLPAVLSIVVLSVLAVFFARAARYTLTSKRLVLQFGVALPMTLNIPLDKVCSASLKTYRDGSGDIPLVLSENKGSFILLWPHVRPWHLAAAQPMLRSIPDAAGVAAKFAEVLSGRPTPAMRALQPGVDLDAALSATAAAA